MADYEILVKAKIETKSVEDALKTLSNDPKIFLSINKITLTSQAINDVKKQLEEKFKNLELNVAPKINTTASSAKKSTGSVGGYSETDFGSSFTGGAGSLVAKGATLDDIITKIREINQLTKDTDVINTSVKTSFLDGEEQVVEATLKYTDLQGRAVQSKYKMVELTEEEAVASGKTTEWIRTENTYLDDAAKRQKELLADEKARQNVVEKTQLSYDRLVGSLSETVKATMTQSTEMSNFQAVFSAYKEGTATTNQLSDAFIKLKAAAKEATTDENKLNSAIETSKKNAEKALARISAYNQDRKDVKAVKEAAEALNAEADGISPSIEKLDKLNSNLSKASSGLRAVGKDALSFGKAMNTAFERIVEWGIATGVIYGTLRQIKEGLQYIKDLNKEMTNIQIVTGASKEDIEILARDYNKLAKELGVTTLEVAKGSLEWQRQGKTAEETAELLQNSVKLGKLANIEQTKSTEYLTSIINGYKLQLKEVTPVLDKLVALDNNYAVSVAGIAEAMQKTANIANSSGVSIEKLAAIITTTADVTQKSADTIGESWKTILTRMQNVKLGKELDDEGESISDVEKVLSELGIKLRDSSHQFRNMGDVLEETSLKYQELAKAGKTVDMSRIAVAFAGTRQRENFEAFMQNYDKYLNALKIEDESLGTLNERYKIYGDSVEAAQNRVTVAWEKMFSDAIKSDTAKFFYNISEGILNLIDKVGLLNVAFAALSSFLMYKLIVHLKLFTTVVEGATVASTGMSAAVAGIAGVAVVAGIIGLIALFDQLNTSATKNLETFENSYSTFKESSDELKSLTKEYEELAKKENKSSDDKERLLDIQTKVNAQYSQGRSGIDLYTAAISGNTDAINDNLKALKEKADFEAKQFLELNKYTYEEAKKKLSEKTQEYPTPVGYEGVSMESLQSPTETLYERKERYIKAIIKTEKEGDLVTSAAARKEYDAVTKEIQAYEKLIYEYEKYQKTITGGMDDQTKHFHPELWDDLGTSISSTTSKLIDVKKAYKEITDVTKDALGYIDSYNEQGNLTIDQTEAMLEKYPDYAKYLSVVNGEVVLNTKSLRDYIVAQYDSLIATLKQQDATNSLIPILEAYRNQIANNTYETKKSIAAEEEAIKKRESAYQALIQMTVNMIKQRKNAEKDALQDELEGYRKIIDAKIKLLELQQSEKEYKKSVEEKNKEIADIDAELLALQFDDSEEAKARKLELEAERVEKVGELDDLQSEHSVETQKNALEEEYQNYEDNLQAQIDAIDDYLQNEGELVQEAMALLNSQSSGFYQELLEWNRKFGTGIDEDVISKWKEAFQVMEEYASRAAQVINTYGSWSPSTGQTGSSTSTTGTGQTLVGRHAQITGDLFSDASANQWIDSLSGRYVKIVAYSAGGNAPYQIANEDGSVLGWVPTNSIVSVYHKGLDAGFVGDKALSSTSEEFAKLLKGEIVTNSSQMDDYVTKYLPKMISDVSTSNQSNSVSFEKLLELNVSGNMTEDLVPTIEEAVNKSIEKLIKALNTRGFTRNANSFST